MHDSPPKPTAPDSLYANCFKVAYNDTEFLLDFGQFYSEQEGVQYLLRVVLVPKHMRELLQLIQTSVVAYESDHPADR